MKIGEPCCDADSVLTAGDLQYGLRRLPGNRLRAATTDSLKFLQASGAKQTTRPACVAFSQRSKSEIRGCVRNQRPEEVRRWALRKHSWQTQEFHLAILRLARRGQTALTDLHRSQAPTKHLMIHFDL